MDLPEKTFVKRVVELTDEQKQLYVSMKIAAMAELKGKTMSTMNVITQMMRLHQITCGHFKADDGTVNEVKSNRMNELLSILEETEGKVIIWANYVHDIEKIVEVLKKPTEMNLQTCLLYTSDAADE